MEDGMFIYSVRASTIRFFFVIALTISLLVGFLIIGSHQDSVAAASVRVDFSGIKSEEDRIAFISQFGITVNSPAIEEEDFRVPENFDRIIRDYNEIQKMQGLNLEKYKNKKVTCYTYEAVGYNGTPGPVYVNLIIYRNAVIACDVSSTDPDGFVSPLVKLS